MKRVLLIVIDALASRVIRPAMQQGRLPHLQALADAGRVDWRCTAIFPSITPAATAALVTGGYPAQTGIAGAYFYDRQLDQIHYYGDDIQPIIRRGFSTFFEEFLVRLNRDQLRIETAFQTVEQAGKRAACLNYLWFLGDVQHRVRVPWLLRLWPGISRTKNVFGPTMLSLGDFVSGRTGRAGLRLKGPGGVWRRFGFTDSATGTELLLLAKERALPEFTVAYFPDNDFDSHSDGPEAAVGTVEQVDRVIGQVIDEYGGIDNLLEFMAVIITGDHGQSDLPLDPSQTGVQLDKVLHQYAIVPAGMNWGHDDELMICPNMRAAQIYLRPGYLKHREAIIDCLLSDARIDQVIWRAEGPERVGRFFVKTASHGLLEFQGGAELGESASDEYGTQWSWQGNLAAVDGRVNPQGILEFDRYPNAFERVAMVFDARVGGDLWVTCRLGHEFRIDGTSVHRRGSHGSLHADDSLSPLIMAGVPMHLLPQRTPRSVDITPFCLSLLGLHGDFTLGAGRAG